MNITGMSEQWVTARIKQKADVLALSIYGLVIFRRALRYVDEAVLDLFIRLNKQVTPVPTILAETFRSLSACRRVGEGSHFRKLDKVSYQVFLKNYSPLKEIVAAPRRVNVLEENWIALLRNIQEDDVEWKAPWLVLDEILFRCGNFDWVPLLGIWGVVGYAPLLVLRQYRSRQFIPATHGLAQYLDVCSIITPEYTGWCSRRVNDNIPMPSLEGTRPIKEFLQVVPSELEIIMQEFERKSLEFGKRIEKLEEEKMLLRLDLDVQKLEAEKIRKENRKVEEDRDDLKIEYKKIQLSRKRVELGKTLEQWQQEIQEEKVKAGQWERKFKEIQARNEILEKSLAESQKEKCGLKARVAELGRSIHHHRSRNSAIELKASLNQIEEMKGKIDRLESVLQNCELCIEQLEARKGHWKEELHHF
ncbi:hypothetical protein J1N35_037825 [Gossypium stocksii]|uniref:DUF7745 domain-containing protein n=1 Tax=Gossypium stocksii TaxID=47602 RepID=A0A9D3ZLA6_9ROSI|nr:hypothetical protein J1N35_037825 [Gossypium stocksii]